MRWIEPQHSRERVKKAGNSILNTHHDSPEFKEALPIFHNWRAAHAFPMQIILDLLRKNAIKADKNALVVQRLKREISIFRKLYRQRSMNLCRMQDIAECRAVVGNNRKVYHVYSRLKNSTTKNVLFRERDYIAKPKESGYRGIHLIYKYNGSKEKFRNLLVEIQIRSRIQHSWATAVEVVGTFTDQALKASLGDSDWLDFFKCASAEFAKLEGCEPSEHLDKVNTLSRLTALSTKLEVEKRLSAFKVAVSRITEDDRQGASYYLLRLDLKKRMLRTLSYKKSELAEATEYYDEHEADNKYNDTIDLVLVSGESIKDLKKAYPNYFSDTAEFSRNLEKVYKQGLRS